MAQASSLRKCPTGKLLFAARPTAMIVPQIRGRCKLLAKRSARVSDPAAFSTEGPPKPRWQRRFLSIGPIQARCAAPNQTEDTSTATYAPLPFVMSHHFSTNIQWQFRRRRDSIPLLLSPTCSLDQMLDYLANEPFINLTANKSQHLSPLIVTAVITEHHEQLIQCYLLRLLVEQADVFCSR